LGHRRRVCPSYSCTLCNKDDHITAEHKCDACGVQGDHRERNCPTKKPCALCHNPNHSKNEHKCNACGALGDHRERACPKNPPTCKYGASCRKKNSGCSYSHPR
jgi:hypothetical protein